MASANTQSSRIVYGGNDPATNNQMLDTVWSLDQSQPIRITRITASFAALALPVPLAAILPAGATFDTLRSRLVVYAGKPQPGNIVVGTTVQLNSDFPIAPHAIAGDLSQGSVLFDDVFSPFSFTVDVAHSTLRLDYDHQTREHIFDPNAQFFVGVDSGPITVWLAAPNSSFGNIARGGTGILHVEYKILENQAQARNYPLVR
jgi:hypothetical protein